MLKVAILDDYQNVAQDFVDLKKLSKKIEKDVYKYLDPMTSISAKTSVGGTAPSQVKKQIIKAKMDLKI